MQLPPEERSYRTRRVDGQNSPATHTGERRLRDDAKPMFQRDITFATPMKDGTAKKGGK